MSRGPAGWALALGLFVAVAWALLNLSAPPESLTREATEALAQSGVRNPVTAVLLNYRSIDTLLELGVLLLAVAAIWAVRPEPAASFAPAPGPLLAGLLRGLVPLLLIAGGYLLWLGAFAPGGAFQGGALVGGAVVLVVLGGLTGRRLGAVRRPLRLGLSAGLVVFSAVGLASAAAGGWFLEYPEGTAKVLILVIESAALVSIGLTLGCLFVGGRPEPDRRSGGGS